MLSSSLHKCLLALATLPACLAATNPLHCPPLGAVLPAPHSPSTNDKVKQAVQGLDQAMGKLTASLNFSAMSISVKSVHEKAKLFSKSYTPPTVDARSATKIDSDTVFRVGSVSKLFTMLGVLKLPGIDLNDPVTKFMPELKEVQQMAEADGLSQFTWDDVTLGALASHLSGMGSDCTLDLELSFSH